MLENRSQMNPSDHAIKVADLILRKLRGDREMLCCPTRDWLDPEADREDSLIISTAFPDCPAMDRLKSLPLYDRNGDRIDLLAILAGVALSLSPPPGEGRADVHQ